MLGPLTQKHRVIAVSLRHFFPDHWDGVGDTYSIAQHVDDVIAFIEKLAALIPPPRIHLTRFHGCLAPHAKIRSQIVPKKEEVSDQTQLPVAPVHPAPKKTNRYGWAELLARVFAIDMKHCPGCGGDLQPVAAILEFSAIKKILEHLGLPDKPPDIAPARLSSQMSFA